LRKTGILGQCLRWRNARTFLSGCFPMLSAAGGRAWDVGRGDRAHWERGDANAESGSVRHLGHSSMAASVGNFAKRLRPTGGGAFGARFIAEARKAMGFKPQATPHRGGFRNNPAATKKQKPLFPWQGPQKKKKKKIVSSSKGVNACAGCGAEPGRGTPPNPSHKKSRPRIGRGMA